MRLSRAIVACACGLIASAAQARSVTLLGSGTAAYGVSADGRTVVGEVGQVGVPFRAFSWTAAGGRDDFGPQYSTAFAVSGDGTTVVGKGSFPVNSSPFRRVGSGPIEVLPLSPPTFFGRAVGVSNDGSVVAGWTEQAGNTNRRGFRWTPGAGLQYLPFSPGTDVTELSRDGQSIVGLASDGLSNQAFVVTIPAPNSIAVLLVGVAMARRRKR